MKQAFAAVHLCQGLAELLFSSAAIFMSVTCPHCHWPLGATEFDVGSRLVCSQCGAEVELEAAATGTRPLLPQAPWGVRFWSLGLPKTFWEAWRWHIVAAAGLAAIAVGFSAWPLYRDAARQTQVDYKQKALGNAQDIAFHLYHYQKDHSRYPLAYSVDSNQRPLLSWRVHLLPLLGQREYELYERFHLDEPWDSQHNRQLLQEMPAIYQNPGLTLPPGHTCWLAVVSKDSVIVTPEHLLLLSGDPPGTRQADLQRGPAGTILFVEVNPSAAVPWTAPLDYAYDTQNPLRDLGAARSGEFLSGWADVHAATIPAADFTPPQLLQLFSRSQLQPEPVEEWLLDQSVRN